MSQQKIQQLRELGRKIEEWRVAHDYSKNKICAKFGQLGSSKTYGRVLDLKDDLAEAFDLDKQLPNYQAAWDLIQEHQEDPEENRIYEDFGFMESALEQVKEAMQQTDDMRLVLITGRPGAGKSAALKLLQADKRIGAVTVRVEATEAWRAKTTDFLGALLTEMGHYDRRGKQDASDGEVDRGRKAELPQSANDRLNRLIERIDGKRIVLAIDEAHHIGAEGYNVIKTLINQTSATVVMAAIPDLVNRINKKSHCEALQLFGRMWSRVDLGSPKTGDVLQFMTRRGLKFATPADANGIARKIADESSTLGLWRYVKRCVREAKRRAGTAWTAEEFSHVIVKVRNSISLS
jgi:type II secretory pathway predicted ATPase ExeA